MFEANVAHPAGLSTAHAMGLQNKTSLEGDDVLIAIAELAQFLLGADGAVISFSDGEPNWDSSLALDTGASASFFKGGTPLPGLHSPSDLVQPLAAQEAGYSAFACVPIGTMGDSINGRLAVLSRASRSFANDDLEVLRRLAGLARAAVQPAPAEQMLPAIAARSHAREQ